ncbi:hypothetical protein Q3G72_006120 [Acer saccharum]|nr:hypothetical protein Q3G72_006120 [Acer saccharum]
MGEAVRVVSKEGDKCDVLSVCQLVKDGKKGYVFENAQQIKECFVQSFSKVYGYTQAFTFRVSTVDLEISEGLECRGDSNNSSLSLWRDVEKVVSGDLKSSGDGSSVGISVESFDY